METIVKQITPGDYPMVAKTIFGLEDVLVNELFKLGAKDIEKHTRAVSFVGDKGFMYKANICLRTALCILKPIKKFKAESEQQLYNEIQKINWEDYLKLSDTLSVDCSLNTDHFNHTLYVAQKVKDGIVDQFRAKYDKRPSVDREHPTLKINIHIYRNECTLSLDSSGEFLYKRGYRDKINLAPINEVLAAGLVLLSGWDKRSNLIDPMCGSGTIAIEAALIANNIPPGYFRKEFGFERWSDFDKELYDTIYDSCIEKITDNSVQIYGSDISSNIIKKAKGNIKQAKVEDVVKLSSCDIQDIEVPEGRGVVIINPPYGERMDKDDDISALYKIIGDTFKKKFSGYDCWIISSNMEALKQISLRPSRKITVFNGSLECKFMKYEMYQGTKRVHKLEPGYVKQSKIPNSKFQIPEQGTEI